MVSACPGVDFFPEGCAHGAIRNFILWRARFTLGQCAPSVYRTSSNYERLEGAPGARYNLAFPVCYRSSFLPS
jgi:hypothetical protein